jgi:hypothetical protein
MVDLLLSLLIVVLIVLVIAVAAVVIAALILVLAWGLSLVFPVSIMEAAVVLMFVAGAAVFYIAVNVAASALANAWEKGTELFDEDWLEDEEDWEEEPAPPVWRKPPIKLPSMPSRSPAARTRRKVGRNEPCPCGSGKKYKHCCGR